MAGRTWGSASGRGGDHVRRVLVVEPAAAEAQSRLRGIGVEGLARLERDIGGGQLAGGQDSHGQGLRSNDTTVVPVPETIAHGCDTALGREVDARPRRLQDLGVSAWRRPGWVSQPSRFDALRSLSDLTASNGRE